MASQLNKCCKGCLRLKLFKKECRYYWESKKRCSKYAESEEDLKDGEQTNE